MIISCIKDGAGDLNGDGQADILWRNDATGQVKAWLITGGAPAYKQHDLPLGNETPFWQVKTVGGFRVIVTEGVYLKQNESGQARIVTLKSGEFSPWPA